MARCTNCYTDNPQTHRFCDGCGLSLSISQSDFEDIGEVTRPLPFVARIKPYLGFAEQRRIHRRIAYALLVMAGILGGLPSPFGHIYTTGLRLPYVPIALTAHLFFFVISYLSPILALRCAVTFSICDFLQKFIIDDVYYPVDRTAIDYVLARVGYIFGYSSVLLAAFLPGVLARMCRIYTVRGTLKIFRRIIFGLGRSYRARRLGHV